MTNGRYRRPCLYCGQETYSRVGYCSRTKPCRVRLVIATRGGEPKDKMKHSCKVCRMPTWSKTPYCNRKGPTHWKCRSMHNEWLDQEVRKNRFKGVMSYERYLRRCVQRRAATKRWRDKQRGTA